MKLLFLLLLIGCSENEIEQNNTSTECYKINFVEKICKVTDNRGVNCDVRSEFDTKVIDCRYYDMYRGNE